MHYQAQSTPLPNVVAHGTRIGATAARGERRARGRRGFAARSLFAMAAWQRMVIGLSALLPLWLIILWATHAA